VAQFFSSCPQVTGLFYSAIVKLTKTVFLTTLAVGGLFACASVRAQNSTTNTSASTPEAANTNTAPRMIRNGHMDRLIQALNLTSDQKAQVVPILQSQLDQTTTTRPFQ
jgi:hypothetical protein